MKALSAVLLVLHHFSETWELQFVISVLEVSFNYKLRGRWTALEV